MNHIAYIKGVLDGDACIEREAKHRPRIVLAVKSRTFAEKFKDALIHLGLSPYITEQHRMRTFNGYTFRDDKFYCRARCDEEKISLIQNIPLKTSEEKISYLTGFFDSEGSYYSAQQYIFSNGKKVKNGTQKRIDITNKNKSLLKKCQAILKELGIYSKIYEYPNRALQLVISRHLDFDRFFGIFGSKYSGAKPT